MLTDLAAAARKSGLKVVELNGWRTNDSAGAPPDSGVLVHHTGSFDEIGDTTDDLSYAKWLAFTGRPPTVPPPLCNLALSAESVVYVCCAGNANHAGKAKASGPMPAAEDGNELYIGIEAMNSGSQGWGSKGTDADGNEITQYDAYVRLCAALCLHYGWPATHVRAHKETSLTGKWDPGLLDMDKFRTDIAALMEDDMPEPKDLWNHEINEIKGDELPAGRMLAQIHNRLAKILAALGNLAGGLADLEAAVADDATKAQVRRLRQDVRDALTEEGGDGSPRA